VAAVPSPSAVLASSQSAPSRAAAPSLPEDSVAGARSEAQWREHLREEERERKMLFDRRRLPQHRAVLAFLQATQARYDRANTPTALLGAERTFAQARPTEQQRLDKLDRWGNSSNLLADYDALLQIFASAYPEARRQALAGSPSPLDAVRQDVGARLKKITEWLVYVEKAETEPDGAEADRRERL
jgi:hypothetical protein